MNKYDPEFARGKRAPGPVPTRDAWQDVKRLRLVAQALDAALANVLPDAEESTTVRTNIDVNLAYAEALIHRYSRTGAPVDQSDLADMEATLRLAAKNPEQFKAFDVEGLRKAALAIRKKGV